MAKIKTRAQKGKSEAYIEDKIRRYAKTLGLKNMKFTSPAHRSVPDRIFFPTGGKCFLIEFKREFGGRLTPRQDLEIKSFMALGYSVFIVSDVQQGKDIIDATLALL